MGSTAEVDSKRISIIEDHSDGVRDDVSSELARDDSHSPNKRNS